MYLELDDYSFPQRELQVSLSSEIDNEDISGETSGTDTVNKGFKAKQLSVSFQIPRDQPELLTEFYRILEAVDNDGNQIVYNINNPLADACRVNKVIFVGRANVSHMNKLIAWQITCNLKEQISIPEKTEQRINPVVETELNTAIEGLGNFELVVNFSELKLKETGET